MTRSKEHHTTEPKSCLSKAAQVATIVAALGAVFFGYQQYRINDTLMRMNQTVAVSAVVEGAQKGELLVRNTGKANLYLARFSLGDRHWAFVRPRLVAANTGGDPGYPVRPGKDVWALVSQGGSATLVLYLKDEFGREWISEVGFVKADDKGGTWVCSYETSREDWKLSGDQTSAVSNEYIEGARFVR